MSDPRRQPLPPLDVRDGIGVLAELRRSKVGKIRFFAVSHFCLPYKGITETNLFSSSEHEIFCIQDMLNSKEVHHGNCDSQHLVLNFTNHKESFSLDIAKYSGLRNHSWV